jgi:hypothetical protein
VLARTFGRDIQEKGGVLEANGDFILNPKCHFTICEVWSRWIEGLPMITMQKHEGVPEESS